MTLAHGRAVRILNALTYVRIALVPVVMVLIAWGGELRYARPAAAILFVLAAATDYFDGRLARKWGAVTALGAFLDTTADKLLVTGALVALVEGGRASMWVATIIIGRELMILGLRGLIAADGTVMKPSIWGKLKANVQFVAITMSIIRWPLHIGPLWLDEWAMWVAAGITVMSGIEYLSRFSHVLGISGRER
ncbi:MAG: CDP-diacylglycerol--glycerol-3-phosphate 3-phosphatidyltransferase [Actinomycetota bacterium]|nr:CDP-diacylglycerol--glycerol-3-phosphate 3-phosphatidyltransferase [Actinomycetota bacterium]